MGFSFAQKKSASLIYYNMAKKVGENMRQSIDTVQLGAAISAVGTILSAIAATQTNRFQTLSKMILSSLAIY